LEYSSTPIRQRKGISLDSEVLETSVTALGTYSLINTYAEVITIHRLLQKVILLKLDEEQISEFVLCCVSNWGEAKGSEMAMMVQSDTLNETRHLRSIWNHVVQSNSIQLLEEYKHMGLDMVVRYSMAGEYYTCYEYMKELRESTLVPKLHPDDECTFSLNIYYLYFNLIFYDQLTPEAEHVFTDCVSFYDTSNKRTLFLVNGTALGLYRNGKLREARQFLVEFLNVHDINLTDVDKSIINTTVGLILIKLGDLAEAESLLTGSLNILRKHALEFANYYAVAANNLAKYFGVQGRFEDSYTVLKDTADHLVDLAKENTSQVLSLGLCRVKYFVAENMIGRGDYDSSLQVIDEVISIATEYLGSGSLTILFAKQLKSSVLCTYLRRHAEGVPLLEEILPGAIRKYGNDSNYVKQIRHDLFRGKIVLEDRDALNQLRINCDECLEKMGDDKITFF